MQNVNYCTESSEKMKNLETLKQRIQILLDMVNTTSPEPTGIEIGIQVQTDSKTIENLRELSSLNFHKEDHLECFCKKNQVTTSYDISNEKQEPFTVSAKCPKVLMVSKSFVVDPIIQVFDKNVCSVTSPRSSQAKKSMENFSLTRLERRKTIHTLTFCKNSCNDAGAKIRTVVMDDGNGDYSNNERFVSFTDHLSIPIDFSVIPKRVAITRHRKSKSESSLLPERKALLCHRSFNVAMPLSAEKINETIEIRKSFDDSTCEKIKREDKFHVELQQNDLQNLTSSHGYTFGGTYRSLNDSTDSSISSSSLRPDNLFPQDFSIDELEHRLCELHRPVHLAPMKLKLPSDKASPFGKEQHLTDEYTQADFTTASNKLLKNIKLVSNIHEPEQYKIMEHFENDLLNKDYYNESPNNYLIDINKEIYSINGETYLIDKLAPICRDRTSVYFRRSSNFCQESYTENHLPAAFSTPMRIDSKDKNSFESKNKKNNDNCESLVRRFADLEMSKKKIPLFKIYKDHLNKMNNEKRIGYVDSEDGEKTVSISLCNFSNNSAISQSKCALTNLRENFEEYSIVNVAQGNNTYLYYLKLLDHIRFRKEERITQLQAKEGSGQRRQMVKVKYQIVFFHFSFRNFQELQDFVDKTQLRKNLLKENKSVLQICKFYHSNSAKSNIWNDKIVGKETRLRVLQVQWEPLIMVASDANTDYCQLHSNESSFLIQFVTKVTDYMINLTFSKNNVFIWNADDWLTLRKDHRIIGELVGCLPKYPRQEVLSGLPLLLLPEEVSLLLEKKIARVVKYSHLQYPPSKSLKGTFDKYREILFMEQERCLKKEKEKQVVAMMDKIVEGKRRKILGIETNKKKMRKPLDKDLQEALRNIEVNTKDLFDEQMSKLPKLEKNEALVQTHTAYPWCKWNNFEVVQWKYPNTLQEKLRYDTFKDLWERGYYITNGEKFGGDFLVYPGDPIMFHSQFIIQCKNRNEEIPITELIGQCRIASHVRKTQILATFSEDGKSVKYQSFQWAENGGLENR
ncbi:centromere-associated protein E-like isoform X6 [Vespula squamosa]|uniref:tRNA-splicing endonuclease subunit SEN34 n=1 Tax=Vespula squamosa TaxID=30214 RepID=A0ABD2A151_VESSQ